MEPSDNVQNWSDILKFHPPYIDLTWVVLLHCIVRQTVIWYDRYFRFCYFRPFRFTRAIASANLSACAIYRIHEKSYSAEKVLFHNWIFFVQSFVFVYECHLWIMRYMSIAYHRRWLRRPERHLLIKTMPHAADIFDILPIIYLQLFCMIYIIQLVLVYHIKPKGYVQHVHKSF